MEGNNSEKESRRREWRRRNLTYNFDALTTKLQKTHSIPFDWRVYTYHPSESDLETAYVQVCQGKDVKDAPSVRVRIGYRDQKRHILSKEEQEGFPWLDNEDIREDIHGYLDVEWEGRRQHHREDNKRLDPIL